MERIRLRFTGLTAYAASLITTLTGFVFTVVITRRLSVEELGTWRYIGTVINYFAIPVMLLGYWATRLTASGERVLRTFVAMSVGISVLAATAFASMAGVLSAPTGASPEVFVVAALEIPSIYLYTALESVAHARRPHVNYYAQLVQEFLKIPLAVALVVLLRLGLTGAILATVAAFTARALAMLYMLRDMEWGTLSGRVAKRMVSAIWLPAYQVGAGSLLALDSVIVMLLSGPEPVGYATAVYLLGSLITMSGTLAVGLYPKMLQESSGRDVESAIGLVYMIAVPTAVGVVILGAPMLNVLRPEYPEAAVVLPVVAVGGILSLLSGMMDSVIAGRERVDFSGEPSFRELVSSRLFLLPTLYYLQALVYKLSLFAALTAVRPNGPVEVLTVWVSVNLMTFAPFVVYKVWVARRMLPFGAPVSALSSYAAAAAVMGVVVYLLRPRELPSEVAPALMTLMPPVITGAAIYFSVLATINRDFRALVRAVMEALT
ncbi:MAG: hypothetical protein RMJ75_05535 [Nitrososphaerota archaeon]|nr:hypothetical protein [Nitrososphaerota archaeon]